MTVLKAIQKLSKLGEVKNNKGFYWVRLNNMSLTCIDNGGTGEATCYHIDHYNEEGEKCHTSYFDNVTQMIKYATR